MAEWRKCELHPDVDPDRMWGCPDCLHYLREENKRLRAVVQEEISWLKRAEVFRAEDKAVVGKSTLSCQERADLLERALKERE